MEDAKELLLEIYNMIHQSHRKKKLTKAEISELIKSVVDKNLKDNYVKNMAQGGYFAQQMILDYINMGKSLDEIKSFIEKNLSQSGKEIMENYLVK